MFTRDVGCVSPAEPDPNQVSAARGPRGGRATESAKWGGGVAAQALRRGVAVLVGEASSRGRPGRARPPRARRAAGWGLALFALSWGCQSDPEPPPQEVGEAEPPEEKKPVVDGKIAQAMAAASNQAPRAAESAASAPPPDGLLDAAAADREAPSGQPASIVFGSAGAAPRVSLQPHWEGASPLDGRLELSTRTGPAALPTVEMSLRLEPKVERAGGALASVSTEIRIPSVKLAEKQPGRLPPGAAQVVGKLAGSRVRLRTTGNGAAVAASFEASDESADLEPLLAGAVTTFSGAALPYPEQPVGIGAYWMVKSREVFSSADVVVYRMVRVEKISPGQIELDVKSRRYLVGTSIPLQGLPPHRVRQFSSEGQGSLRIAAGSPFPSRFETRESMAVVLSPDDRPAQALTLRAELDGLLELGVGAPAAGER